MEQKEILDVLDKLCTSPHLWDHIEQRGRVSVSVGDEGSRYTIHVDRRTSSADWRVEHERFGVLVDWTPANGVSHAKGEAVDYVRAHLLGRTEPQHA